MRQLAFFFSRYNEHCYIDQRNQFDNCCFCLWTFDNLYSSIHLFGTYCQFLCCAAHYIAGQLGGSPSSFDLLSFDWSNISRTRGGRQQCTQSQTLDLATQCRSFPVTLCKSLHLPPISENCFFNAKVSIYMLTYSAAAVVLQLQSISFFLKVHIIWNSQNRLSLSAKTQNKKDEHACGSISFQTDITSTFVFGKCSECNAFRANFIK